MKLMCFWQTLLLLFVGLAGSTSAAEPLHVRIDQLIEKRAEGRPLAKPASDAEFLRRVFLDFSGRIPTAQEARKFLADSSPTKRTALIDQLIKSEEYPARMAELFNRFLMERRGENADWTKYLEQSFQKNKSWDQLVSEILKPDVQNEEERAAVFFVQKRLESYGANAKDFPGLTRDVGRLFLGLDLQCAECHDHLFIQDYKQADFQGLHTVFKNTFVKTDPKAKFPALQEKAMMEKLEFTSVFDPTQKTVGPRIPGGQEFAIPAVPEPAKKPAKPTPKKGEDLEPGFSPLALFSENLPSSKNKLFTKNIANRLWFMMMGRGLVHPLDLHHSANPPSHPELLNLLAEEIAAHQFDLKWFLRELALTETYARSSLIPDEGPAPAEKYFTVAIERRLSAEQLLASTLIATGEKARIEKIGKEADTDESGPTWKELRKEFLDAFANEAREPEDEVSVSVEAGLYLLNADRFQLLLDSRAGNLIDRLSKLSDSKQIAEELYLSVLTRMPTEVEQTEVAELLQKFEKRKALALKYYAWAMLSSVEFSVNH